MKGSSVESKTVSGLTAGRSNSWDSWRLSLRLSEHWALRAPTLMALDVKIPAPQKPSLSPGPEPPVLL